MNDAEKLEIVAEEYGMSVSALIRTYFLKSVVPGICMNDWCDFIAEYEPDQREGWCDLCETQTVISAIELAGY